jgi:membrane protease YdiL (CAAX protease family)
MSNEEITEPQKGGIKECLSGGIITSYLIAMGFMLVNVVITFIGKYTIDALLQPALSALFDEAGASYFLMYFDFVYSWAAVLLVLFIFKRGRKYPAAFGPRPSGNTPKNLLIGTLVGLAMNAFCIGAAVLCGNIQGFEFVGFQPLQIVLFLVVVLIQCSSEEIEGRGFLFQRIGHKYGVVAGMVANSVFFSLSHLLNGGINPLALISIFCVGIVLSMVTYYFDSLWMAFGIHTGWNFCQGVLFGLPNSGQATGYAIFRPVGELTNSFAYDVAFGVESTVVAVALFIVIAAGLYLWGKKHSRPHFDVFEQQ